MEKRKGRERARGRRGKEVGRERERLIRGKQRGRQEEGRIIRKSSASASELLPPCEVSYVASISVPLVNMEKERN